MNRLDPENFDSGRMTPSRETSIFGEDVLAEWGCFCLHALQSMFTE